MAGLHNDGNQGIWFSKKCSSLFLHTKRNLFNIDNDSTILVEDLVYCMILAAQIMDTVYTQNLTVYGNQFEGEFCWMPPMAVLWFKDCLNAHMNDI